ncbi:pyridoxal phosphate-dependent aminotransferase, partial [candidate division KSB1 bacterium]|nr:pyridoxal phosphate-dependent aminotransferase [candidate division KSB1 bacterium]
IISSGAKNCLYNVCQVVLDTGLEAIIPAPYWVSYPAMVALARGTPVLVRTYEADGFRLTPATLQAAITPNTRALILNNPCNPTGAFYQRDHLEPLLEIARAAKLIIIADEVYEKLTYDGLKFVSVAALSAEARQQCVVINGVSKSYAMTGWRIGYAAGPAALITAMNKVQSHSTSNASSISQMATIEALQGSQHSVARMVAEFQKRRDYMAHRLRQIPGITCHQSQGAFYLFPNFSAYLDREFEGHRLGNSYDLTNYLLEQARVAVVPGAAFGGENYIRFAYAAAQSDLETAMDRITHALLQLR